MRWYGCSAGDGQYPSPAFRGSLGRSGLVSNCRCLHLALSLLTGDHGVLPDLRQFLFLGIRVQEFVTYGVARINQVTKFSGCIDPLSAKVIAVLSVGFERSALIV